MSLSKPIINFYSTKAKYGFCSNFYLSPFYAWVDQFGRSVLFKTSEHYFQAHKFLDSDIEWAKSIINAKTASEAAKMGRSRAHRMTPKWEDIKVSVMREALRFKFIQNPELKEKLIQTHGYQLVEHTKNDSYWGDGGHGSGKNILGKLLTKLAEEFYQQEQEQQE